MLTIEHVIVFVICLVVFLILWTVISTIVSNFKVNKTIDILTDQSELLQKKYLNTYKFLPLRDVEKALKRKDGRRNLLYELDFAGCYIFQDQTTGKYYVGQSIHVIHRLVQHLRGKGSLDIYNAVAQGHVIYYSALKFKNSPYTDLNQMERVLIKKFNSDTDGYNQTSGNGRLNSDFDQEEIVLNGVNQQRRISKKMIIAVVVAYHRTHPKDKDFKRKVKRALKS